MDPDVYNKLVELMVPPVNDANAVIRSLLFQEGHDSDAAVSLASAEHHFTMEEEIKRAGEGIYESGGNT